MLTARVSRMQTAGQGPRPRGLLPPCLPSTSPILAPPHMSWTMSPRHTRTPRNRSSLPVRRAPSVRCRLRAMGSRAIWSAYAAIRPDDSIR